MARPRKSEHIREELLNQGIDLLTEHGYHGTGIKKILDAVKVPKGSFYNFFKSKEHFAAEVIDRYAVTAIKCLDQSLDNSTDDPVTTLKNAHHVLIEAIEKDGMQGCLIGNLSAELGNASEICRLKMKQASEAWRKRYIVLLAKAQEQDLIRKDISIDAMANMLWGAWQGGLLQMKVDGNTLFLKHNLDLIMGALLKQP